MRYGDAALIGAKVELDPASLLRMNRRIHAYKNTRGHVLRAATVMTEEAQKDGIKIVHEELVRAVYSSGGSGDYERTYALYNAVQVRGGPKIGFVTGEIYMSSKALRSINPASSWKGDYFNYIQAVEGGHGGSPAMPARPYWRPASLRIKNVFFHDLAPAARTEIELSLRK